MDLIELITPSGFKAYFKPFLTFGQRREIEKFTASKVEIDPLTQQPKNGISALSLYEGEDMVLKMLLDHIIINDQTLTGEEAYLAVQNFENEEDGKVIYSKINEIVSSKNLPTDKKK